jgi:hypothetical protein
MSGFYVEIILPEGTIEEFARLQTFAEAIVWLDAHKPAFEGSKGRLFGVATSEQIRILPS